MMSSISVSNYVFSVPGCLIPDAGWYMVGKKKKKKDIISCSFNWIRKCTQ